MHTIKRKQRTLCLKFGSTNNGSLNNWYCLTYVPKINFSASKLVAVQTFNQFNVKIFRKKINNSKPSNE